MRPAFHLLPVSPYNLSCSHLSDRLAPHLFIHVPHLSTRPAGIQHTARKAYAIDATCMPSFITPHSIPLLPAD